MTTIRRYKTSKALPEHIPYLAEHMREADAREVWASHRKTPHEALAESLARSDMAWTFSLGGLPAFMGGVGPHEDKPGVGVPWLLGTPLMQQANRQFIRLSRDIMYLALRYYPRLENYTHAGNDVSLRWLEWLGFTIEKDMPVVMHGEPFYLFWREFYV